MAEEYSIMCVCGLSHFSCVWLFATLWTGSSIHEVFQARVLEWVATPSSRGSSWPSHVGANGIISFFFMTEQYSIVYMYHIFFIHSPPTDDTVIQWNRTEEVSKRLRFGGFTLYFNILFNKIDSSLFSSFLQLILIIISWSSLNSHSLTSVIHSIN